MKKEDELKELVKRRYDELAAAARLRHNPRRTFLPS